MACVEQICTQPRTHTLQLQNNAATMSRNVHFCGPEMLSLQERTERNRAFQKSAHFKRQTSTRRDVVTSGMPETTQTQAHNNTECHRRKVARKKAARQRVHSCLLLDALFDALKGFLGPQAEEMCTCFFVRPVVPPHVELDNLGPTACTKGKAKVSKKAPRKRTRQKRDAQQRYDLQKCSPFWSMVSSGRSHLTHTFVSRRSQ